MFQELQVLFFCNSNKKIKNTYKSENKFVYNEIHTVFPRLIRPHVPWLEYNECVLDVPLLVLESFN